LFQHLIIAFDEKPNIVQICVEFQPELLFKKSKNTLGWKALADKLAVSLHCLPALLSEN
jgi:hypothetical protein